HRVLLAVNEAGHGTGPDVEGVPVCDDLALPFDEVEDLRVSVAVGRRLHPGIHLREAHEHEVAVVRPHDLLVHDSGANALLPRLVRQVSHDRSHGPTPWCAHGRDISISMITCNHATPAGDDRAALRGPRATRRRPRGVRPPRRLWDAMASAKSESDSPWRDRRGGWADIPAAGDPEPRVESRLIRHPGSSRPREACTNHRPQPEHREPAPAPRDATDSAGVA